MHITRLCTKRVPGLVKWVTIMTVTNHLVTNLFHHLELINGNLKVLEWGKLCTLDNILLYWQCLAREMYIYKRS